MKYTKTVSLAAGLFTLIAVAVISCTHTPVEKETTLSPESTSPNVILAYQMGREATLDPCGCHSNPVGGADREFNLLQALRKEAPVLYVEGGNTYAPVKKSKSPESYYKERATAVTDILNDLGVDVWAPGPTDIALGKDFLLKHKNLSKAKWLHTNLVDASGKTVLPAFETIEKGGARFGILAISPSSLKARDGMKLTDPEKALSATLELVGSNADYWIVLSQLADNDKDVAMAKKFPQVSFWIGNDSRVTLNDAVQVAPKTLSFDAHQFGYMLGVVRLQTKSPYQGLTSLAQIKRNNERLATYEKVLNQYKEGNPKREKIKKELDELKSKELFQDIPGATHYESSVIGLDIETYGTANGITEKIKKEKARVQRKALDSQG